jgi:hypothetical protein
MNRTLLTAVERVRRARGRIQQGRIRLVGTSEAHPYIIYSMNNKNCVSVLPWTPNGTRDGPIPTRGRSPR